MTDFSTPETAPEASQPVKLSARDKAAATNEAAWAIIDAEASAREDKTEKLRALRLKREQAEAKDPVLKSAPARRRALKR